MYCFFFQPNYNEDTNTDLFLEKDRCQDRARDKHTRTLTAECLNRMNGSFSTGFCDNTAISPILWFPLGTEISPRCRLQPVMIARKEIDDIISIRTFGPSDFATPSIRFHVVEPDHLLFCTNSFVANPFNACSLGLFVLFFPFPTIRNFDYLKTFKIFSSRLTVRSNYVKTTYHRSQGPYKKAYKSVRKPFNVLKLQDIEMISQKRIFSQWFVSNM